MRLTPTSYVVLGVIALRGPTTGYELGRYVEGSIEHFWPVLKAQLYREPKRLVDGGLLDVEQEDSGRRRQIFTLTSAGRAALEDWLTTPTEPVLELRDAGLVKLHFAGLMDRDARRRLATEQRELRQARLREFEALAERYADQEALAMGIALERAAVRFWRSLEADL